MIKVQFTVENYRESNSGESV